jgi:hypothetical protein
MHRMFFASTFEQPLGDATSRLLLHHERQPGGAALVVHHRPAPVTGNAFDLHHDELAGVEVHRTIELHLDRQNVTGQLAHFGYLSVKAPWS